MKLNANHILVFSYGHEIAAVRCDGGIFRA